MASLSDELSDSILERFSKDDRLSSPPTMQRKSRGNHSIHTGNYYFKQSTDIQGALDEISETIESKIKSHILSKGELIKGVISKGYIWDDQKVYFEIRSGIYFEVYCFKCKSLTFIRVTHEKTLFSPEKQWLSIDMDEDHDTLWLEESR
jgi:hypothetical protein